MFSRYRSYTCYSEENGKLVPSVEPSNKQPEIKVVIAFAPQKETDKSPEIIKEEKVEIK